MRHAPSSIEVILHYYYSPEPHPRTSAPAVHDAIIGFVNDGILEEVSNSRSGYEVTEKGRAWVEMICTTPYPTRVWVDERTGTQLAKEQ